MEKKYSCEFINECPDMKLLRKITPEHRLYEELTSQHEELCSIGGHGCSIRNSYLKQEKK